MLPLSRPRKKTKQANEIQLVAMKFVGTCLWDHGGQDDCTPFSSFPVLCQVQLQ